jgi:hypothetical protein
MKTEENLTMRLLDKLIADGRAMVELARKNSGGFAPTIDNKDAVLRWANELILFKSRAGSLVLPWDEVLQHNGVNNRADTLAKPLSALETIKFALQAGLLARHEDLVVAATFADLNAQGGHLLSQGYFLAAGVIFHAVLEEKLRRLCEREKCMPTKPRPTMNDLNQSLYGSKPPVYDKNMMLHVQSLAGIGNDAAHNAPTLKVTDVERLKAGVEDFLSKFP